MKIKKKISKYMSQGEQQEIHKEREKNRGEEFELDYWMEANNEKKSKSSIQ